VKVLNLKKDKFNFGEDFLYIGRENKTWKLKGSKWANPYVCTDESLRDSVVDLYEDYIRRTPELWNALEELDGKKLLCWCAPYKKCHGNILIKLLNEKKLAHLYQ